MNKIIPLYQILLLFKKLVNWVLNVQKHNEEINNKGTAGLGKISTDFGIETSDHQDRRVKSF